MKKMIVVLAALVLLVSCTRNMRVKNLGGSMSVDMEPGQKVVVVTWKDDDSLWYLTRPMRPGEVAETYTHMEKSSFGVFEGKVTIIEHDAGGGK